ncbi:MAG TPA: hypothetical protein VK669_14695 [Candidatus Limnocylindrales bacterium]|nr:hypothetical protein [Candidatus Limnocylindrales bacterium]
MDLDGLFGSRIAGRALMLIRRLGGADIAELADLLGERRRPVVRRALRRFVALGVLRIAPRSGLRRPYVLAPDWPGAAPLARLLDLHLDAVPQLARRAALSARIPEGRRGRRGPRAVRDRTPHGLDAAPAFAPFMPPSHAKAVALLAKHGPVGTMGIAAALRVGRGTALALGAALCERRLATSATAPFAKGVERWYGLTAAGSAIGDYLVGIVGSVRRPQQRGVPPCLPQGPTVSWRVCTAVPSTPQYTALRALDTLVDGALPMNEIARRVGTQGRRVRPHLDAFVRVGLLAVAFPANVPTYAFDDRTPQGRAALNLFRMR